jgi:uncharacterized ion transporter superfamily protein YfcC
MAWITTTIRKVKMYRYRSAFSLIGLVLLIGGLCGCDNRTGFEKGVDHTVDEIKDIAK